MHRLSCIIRPRACQVAELFTILLIAGHASAAGVRAVSLKSDTCPFGRCGALREVPVWFSVFGTGVCTLRVDFGDGTPVVESPSPINLDSQSWDVHHVYYQSWPGPKTVRADSVSTTAHPCSGTATVAYRVFDITDGNEMYDVALALPRQMCYVVPGGLPPLRIFTKVTVSATRTPQVDFGCPSGGCVYDPDGKPGSSAPSRFPFPGFREFSLVLRVGSQLQQGGVNESTFRTRQAGSLELCLNDDKPWDNGGGWEVHLSVDESQARLPSCLETCATQLNNCLLRAQSPAERAVCSSQQGQCMAVCPPFIPSRAECLDRCGTQLNDCLLIVYTPAAREVCSSQQSRCFAACPP
jgi:hypothetical protein